MRPPTLSFTARFAASHAPPSHGFSLAADASATIEMAPGPFGQAGPLAAVLVPLHRPGLWRATLRMGSGVLGVMWVSELPDGAMLHSSGLLFLPSSGIELHRVLGPDPRLMGHGHWLPTHLSESPKEFCVTVRLQKKGGK